MHNRSTYVIAEIASAHEGNTNLIYRLIKNSSKANADAIKFQIFHPNELAVRSFRYYGLYKRLHFTKKQWSKIIDYSKKNNLDVWVDPYDRWGLDIAKSFIDDITGVKIPPAILSDIKLTRDIMELKCKKLIGVSGFSITQIKKNFKNMDIKQNNDMNEVFILYGFQRFPTKIEDLNLDRMKLMKNKFNIPVGYADHVDGNSQLAKVVPCLAVALGAEIIEKHITIDRSKKGLDYYSSLNPDEFKEMVELIRNTEKAVGSGEITEEEKGYLKDATKIVAKSKIGRGKMISKSEIAYKRSDEDGLLPYEKNKVIGKIALGKIKEEETIKLENIKKPRICALVAVRMKSKRLPKKALLDIGGYTAIERVINNLKPSKKIDKIILATSTNKQDNPIEELAKRKSIPFFRGEEDNVIKRFIGAAERFNADIIVRVTGDCPLVSYEITDYLIESHLENGSDYTGIEANTVPVGTFSEVITLSALKKLADSNIDPNYSEYMTYYFRNNPNFFSINISPVPDEIFNRPHYRMTLDHPEDLVFFRKIFEEFKPREKAIPLRKTITFLDKHPEIVSINKDMSLKWRDNEKLIKKLNRITRLESNGI